MASEHLFVLGLVAPRSHGPPPYPEGVLWWNLRHTVAQLIEWHETTSVGSLFFHRDTQDSLERIGRIAAKLDDEWTALYRRFFVKADNTPLLAPDQVAYLFDWKWVGPSFVTVARDNTFEQTTPERHSSFSSVSLVLESAMIKYLRVAVELQLSVLHTARSEHVDATKHILLAVELAKHCAQHIVPLHCVSNATCDQLYLTPPVLALHFWRRWLASILVAHAKHSERLRSSSLIGGLLAEFNSAQLLETVVGRDAPPFIISHAHALGVSLTGLARKASVLSQIAIGIGQRARGANDTASMILAARILAWCGEDLASEIESACLETVLMAKSINTNYDNVHVIDIEFADVAVPTLVNALLVVPHKLYTN